MRTDWYGISYKLLPSLFGAFLQTLLPFSSCYQPPTFVAFEIFLHLLINLQRREYPAFLVLFLFITLLLSLFSSFALKSPITTINVNDES